MRAQEFIVEANSNLNGLHNRKKYQRTLQVLQLAYGEEEGQQMLDQYIHLVDQLIEQGGTVYRGIWVAPGTKPRLSDPGQHWALTLQAAEEYLDSDSGWGAYADFQGDNDDLEPVPYIISATVGPNSITNKGVFFDKFPEEMEVRLVNPQAATMKIVKKVKGLVGESTIESMHEETMPELEYDRSLNYSEEHNGITLRAQIIDAGILEITASVNGEEIGYVNFASFGDTIQAKSVEVKPEYRRKGIATMMYDFAESLGNDIEPSQALTDPGKAFWSQRDPEADITE